MNAVMAVQINSTEMEVEAAEGGDGDDAGTTAHPARLAGAWNKHDDAAVAGILAAARAAGATGASVRYGGVITKVWFEPHGSDLEEVAEKTKKLQLATVQARLGELERRAAGETNRARKERERKKRQKAAKQAAPGQTEQHRREQQRAAAQYPARSEVAQQLAHAAQQHLHQRSPADKAVVEPATGCRSTDAKGKPASGLAPSTPPVP